MSPTSVTLLEKLRDPTDETAWQRLFFVYQPLLLTWLGRYALQPTDAEDVLQEVLAVLFRELPQFQHSGRRGAFRRWLRSVMVNRLLMFWRLRKTIPVATGDSDFLLQLQTLEDSDAGLSGQWEREHDQFVLCRLLALIQPEFEATTWQAFRRVVFDGVKPALVAAEMGMSVDAVYMAKCRILQRLRQEFQAFPE